MKKSARFFASVLVVTTSLAQAQQSYQVPIHPGLNAIANQLDRGGNTLNEILPSVPNGCVLSKFNNTSRTWAVASYDAAAGSWMPGNITLDPGDGAFLDSPTSFVITFSGKPHVPVLPLQLPPGCYFLSRQTNGIGTYENIMGAPPPEGTQVYRWNGANYDIFTYLGLPPPLDWDPSAPILAVGEPAWINPDGQGCTVPATPVANCPQSKTVNCATPWSFDLPSMVNPCAVSNVTISILSTVTNGPCPQIIKRTWLLTDSCGNSVACSQTVTVVDTIPPVLTGCSNRVVNCTGPNGAPVAYTVTATDNCDTNVAAVCLPPPGSLFPLGPTPVVCSAADRCSNAVSCQFLVTVLTNCLQPCVRIVCPTNLTAFACASNSVPVFFTVVATNLCNPSDLTVACVPPSGIPFPLGTTPVTCRATGSGETNFCTFTVTVLSGVPPSLTCATNKVVECGTNWTFDPPTLNPGCCGTNLVLTVFNTATNPGPCVTTHTRTWRAAGCGPNVLTCSQTVSVVDTTPPVFTQCPPDLNLGCNPATVPGCNQGQVAAVDNCGAVTISCASVDTTNGCSHLRTITYTAMDGCSNRATCVQRITWTHDTTPPVFTVCPTNMDLGCNPPVIPTCGVTQVAAVDDCGPVVITCSSVDTTNGCSRLRTVTYTATDNCTNRATCVQLITWKVDTTPPVITLSPQNYATNFQCFADYQAAPPIVASAFDNCDGTNVNLTAISTISGTCPTLINICWTATDGCSNKATVCVVITIRDTIPPVIRCPTNIIVGCDTNIPPCPTSLAGFLAIGGFASDNCDTNPQYFCFDGPLIENQIVRTHTVCDDCTNCASCTQIITFVPTDRVVLDCPPDQTVECLSEVPPALTNLVQFLAAGGRVSTTNLLGYTCTSGPLVGDRCNGTITRTYTATDLCSNTVSCQHRIVVRDTTPPNIMCGADKEVQCGANWAFDIPTAVDACGGAILTLDAAQEPGGSGGTGIGSGSATLSGNTLLVNITFSGLSANSTAAHIHGPAGRGTNAAVLYPLTLIPSGTTAGAISQTVTLINGTGGFTIAQQLQQLQSGLWYINIHTTAHPGGEIRGQLDASAVIEVVSTVTNVPPVRCPSILSVTRTWRASDTCSNSAFCSQTVTIIDTEPPKITLTPASPQTNFQCFADYQAAPPIVASAFDNCDGTNVVLTAITTISGTCPTLIDLCWTATDGCSNRATVCVAITIRDTIPPFIICPTNLTVQCLADVSARPATLAQFLAAGGQASDNCDTNLTYQSSDTPLVDGACGGTIVRTHTVIDDCTNSASCIQIITIHDTTPPVFTVCPTNMDLGCNPPVIPTCGVTQVAAVDDCGPVVITCSSVDTTNGCSRFRTITYIATDNCTNRATCGQLITWKVDTTPPVFSGCQNISTNSLAGTNGNFVTYSVSALDNCDGPLPVTCVPPSGSFFLDGQTLVTCAVVDQCGNTNTCQFTVSILNPCVTLTNNLRPLFIALDSVERPGGVVLRWEGGGQLQTAASLENPVWVNMAGSSPLLVPAPLVPSGNPSDPSAGKRFFRTLSADGSCSLNIVGYVNFTLTGGQQYLLANPLNGTNNLLDTILPLPASADGTAIYRFDPASQTINDPIFWSSPGWFAFGDSLEINPGEGFVMLMEGNHSVTFVGEVPQGTLANPLPSGFSYQSSMAALDGQVSGVPYLGLPGDDGDVIRIFDPATQLYQDDYTYIGGFGWFSANADDPGPDGPIIRVGTGFVFYNAGAAKIWTQHFLLSDCAIPSCLSCATNKTVECGSGWTFDPPDASACCGTNVTVALLGTITNGTCPQVITRTWQTVDCCNNTNTCRQAVTVVDTTPPVMACATNKSVECGSAWSFDRPSASDLCCGSNVTVQLISTNSTVVSPCLTVWQGIWRATDCCTNSVTCTQTVSVVDTAPPVITCASNKIVQCGNNWTFDPPTAFDLCCGTNVTITFSTVTNSTAPLVVTRTWQATDCCTNISPPCSQTVTVLTNCCLFVSNESALCSSNGFYTYAFDIRNDSGQTAYYISLAEVNGTQVITLPLSPPLPSGQSRHITQILTGVSCAQICYYIALHNQTLAECCSQQRCVTVVDTRPPVMACATNKTVECGSAWSFDRPSASDLCCGTNVTVQLVSSNSTVISPCLTLWQGVWRATDCCSNSVTCTQTVSVVDTVPPILTGCSNLVVDVSLNQTGAVVNFTLTATDNCSGARPVVCVPPGGSFFNVGTNPVRCTAFDACGNSNTCQFTVTVRAGGGTGDLWVEDTPYSYAGAPDLGREPDPNMAGQDMWMSRAIWVHEDCLQPPGTYLTHQNPRFGQTNCVFVRVQNRGSASLAGAQLKVYFANASLGLTWPAQWTLLGTYPLPAIGPGAAHVAQLPWLPPGTGHFCLLARIVSPDDPMAVPETGNIGANTRANNNIAWRNVNVLNLLHTTGNSCEVRVRHVPRTTHQAAQGPTAASETAKPAPPSLALVFIAEEDFLTQGGEAYINLGPLFAQWQAAGAHGTNITLAGGTKVRFTNSPARLEGLILPDDGDWIANLIVLAPQPMPVPGTNHVYVVQLIEEIDGESMGGISYAVVSRALDTDTDGDGVADVVDPDVDGDGIPNAADAVPLGELDCPPAALTVTRVGGDLVLTWSGLGYRLEAVSNLGDSWTTVIGATSPFTLTPSDPRRFFRLNCP